MIAISSGVVVSVLTFGSAVLALYVQRRLPAVAKSDSIRGLIGQVSGVVSLLLAMVLGTLVGTSFGLFFAQRANLDAFAAQVLQFDQSLAQYGSETKPARAALKEVVVQGYNLFWGHVEANPEALAVANPLKLLATIEAYLASLEPTTETQKRALAKANQYAAAMEQSRLLMSLQVAGQSVPWQLVAILCIWAIALFFGYGLFAPSHPAIIAALAFGAVSIGLAVFLIFDLRQPYTGVFRISPAPLEQAIGLLNV